MLFWRARRVSGMALDQSAGLSLCLACPYYSSFCSWADPPFKLSTLCSSSLRLLIVGLCHLLLDSAHLWPAYQACPADLGSCQPRQLVC